MSNLSRLWDLQYDKTEAKRASDIVDDAIYQLEIYRNNVKTMSEDIDGIWMDTDGADVESLTYEMYLQLNEMIADAGNIKEVISTVRANIEAAIDEVNRIILIEAAEALTGIDIDGK